MGLPGWTALIVGMTSLDLNGIPAPAPGQRFVDGRDIPDGATFEEAYAAFFAPLTAWEAEFLFAVVRDVQRNPTRQRRPLTSTIGVRLHGSPCPSLRNRTRTRAYRT